MREKGHVYVASPAARSVRKRLPVASVVSAAWWRLTERCSRWTSHDGTRPTTARWLAASSCSRRCPATCTPSAGMSWRLQNVGHVHLTPHLMVAPVWHAVADLLLTSNEGVHCNRRLIAILTIHSGEHLVNPRKSCHADVWKLSKHTAVFALTGRTESHQLPWECNRSNMSAIHKEP